MDVLKALGGQKWQHNKVKRAFRLSCPFTEAATPPLSLFSRNGFQLGWDRLYEGRTRRPPVANSAVAPFRADPRFAKLMRAGRFRASMLSKEQGTGGPPAPPTPFRLLWPTRRHLRRRSLALGRGNPAPATKRPEQAQGGPQSHLYPRRARERPPSPPPSECCGVLDDQGSPVLFSEAGAHGTERILTYSSPDVPIFRRSSS